MAENDGRYGFGVTLTDESVKRVAEEVKKEFQGMSQSAAQEGAKMESSFRKIGTALGVGFSLKAAADFGKQIVKVRGEIESLEVSFRTLLGSEQKATALMTDIRKFAATTPMQLNDLASGAQTLLGFNIEAEKVMPTLKALGDISMGDSQKFQSLTLAFAQMSSTGKLMGQDLLQMINAGFNPLVQIAERTGKSVAELKEEMSQGKISVEMVTQAFMDATSEGGKFYNMLEKQSKGIQGSLSNLKGAFDDMLNDIGENSDGVITKSVQGLTKLVQNYETVGKVIGTLVATYGSYKAAVMAYNVIATISNGLTAGLTAKEIIHAYTLGLVEKAQKLLNATMLKNPYVLAATALISLVSALVIFSKRTDEAERRQKTLNGEVEKLAENYDKAKQSADEFISVLSDDNATPTEKKTAYDGLIDMLPNYLKGLNTQEEKEAAINELLKDRIKLKEALEDENVIDGQERTDSMLADLDKVKEYEQLIDTYRNAQKEVAKDLNDPKRQTHIQELSNEIVKYQQLRDAILNTYKDAAKEAGYSSREIGKYLEETARASQKAVQKNKAEINQARFEAKPIEQKIEITESSISIVKGQIAAAKAEAEKNRWDIPLQLNLKLLEDQLAGLEGRLAGYQAAVTNAPKFSDLRRSTQTAYATMTKAQSRYHNNPTKANEEAYDKAKDSFDTYDKQYEKATGKKYSDWIKDAKDKQKKQKELDEAFKKEQKEYAKWLVEQARQEEFDRRQAGIDAMKDGLKKTLDQIGLDYDQQLAAIDDRESDMVEKLRKLKEEEWKAANPTKKNSENPYSEGNSTMTVADLDEEQQKQLTAQRERALAERNRLEREAMDELTGAKKTYLAQQAEMERQYLSDRKALIENGASQADLALFDRNYVSKVEALFDEAYGEYKTYEQRRLDIAKVYAKKREELYQHNADGSRKKDAKGNDVFVDGLGQGNVTEIDRQEDEEINALIDGTASQLSAALYGKTIEELKHLRDEAAKALSKAKSSPMANTKEGKEAIRKAEKELESYNQAVDDAVNKSLVKWDRVAGAVGNLGNAFHSLCNAIGDANSESIAFVGDMFNSISTTINGITELTEISAKSIEGVSETAATAIKAVESASVVLTIISAAIQLIKGLSDALDLDGSKEQAERAAKAAASWQNSIDRLTRAYDDLSRAIENAYSTERAGLIQQQILNKKLLLERYKQQWEELYEAIRQMSFGGLDVMGEALRQAAEQMGMTFEELLQQYGYTYEEYIIEMVSQLVGPELADQLREIYDNIRQTETDIANLEGGIEEAIWGQDIRSAIESFGDALIDAWTNGTNAAMAGQDAIRDMIKRRIREELMMEIQKEKILLDLQDKIEQAKADGIITEAELAEILEMGDEAAEALAEKYKEQFEMLRTASERSAVAHGIATASQESVDELNGRMTAVQGHTFNLSENSNIIRDNIIAINGSVHQIEIHTQHLIRMDNDIHNLKASFDTIINSNGIRIRN